MKKSRLRYVRCNLCGFEDYKIFIKSPFLDNQDKRRKFATTSGFIGGEQIVKCKNCGLIYVTPQTPPEEILKGYAEADERAYVKEEKARTKTFAGCLSTVEKYKKPPGRLLDVGCAAGLFLNLAQQHGWEVEGIEPNKQLAGWGNKKFSLSIKTEVLEKIRFPNKHFDVITFWDVLEHLPNPKETLLETARVLKRGGILIVNYPDIGSIPARVFGRRWWFILSVHLFYFTPETIRTALEKTGFEILKIKPHFQRLSLGYLVFRLKPYSPLLHNMMAGVTKALKLGNLEIPYYAGQTMVITEKK